MKKLLFVLLGLSLVIPSFNAVCAETDYDDETEMEYPRYSRKSENKRYANNGRRRSKGYENPRYANAKSAKGYEYPRYAR